MGIIRQQTTQEKGDFISLYTEEPSVKFKKELIKHEQIAHKKGLPFADKPAMDEFDESIQSQAKESLKQHGKVDLKDIKIPKMDWAKYSDLKNFKVMSTKRVRDKYLSKLHKMPIFIDSKVYQFKGYGNKYRIMEDGDLAVEKAFKKEAESKQ